jgi:hypothetical protein
MAPTTGYFRTKAAIKARSSSNRANGYFVSALSGNQLKFYVFVSASTAKADDESVLMPDDNPATGRWHEYGESYSFMHELICTHDCSVGKKIIKLHSGSFVPMIVVPSYDINITTGADSIAIRRWTEEPNLDFIGKESSPIATFSNEGGAAIASADAGHRWFTFEVRNPAKDNVWDTACVLAEKSNYLLVALVGV